VTPLFNLYKQFCNVLKLSKYDTDDIHYHVELNKKEGNPKVTHPLPSACHGNVEISSGTSKNARKLGNDAFHKQRVALLRFWKQTTFRLRCAHTSGTGFRQFGQVTTPELCAATNTTQAAFHILETQMKPFIEDHLTIIPAN